MAIKYKKGQLSIELIIILAILLGVVFLVASKMRESAGKASQSIENTSEKIYGEIEDITTQAPISITNSVINFEFGRLYKLNQLEI